MEKNNLALLLVVACVAVVAIVVLLKGSSSTIVQDDKILEENVAGQAGTVPASCLNKKRDGKETDVDCGGNKCPKCADGKKCKKMIDCSSSVCATGACQPPSCTDKMKNQDETDIDCGGVCGKCADNKKCLKDNDCSSGWCLDSLCRHVPVCTDGVKNGYETGVDCGGGACPPCSVGKSCLIYADCESNTCTNKVCQAEVVHPDASCNNKVKDGSEVDVDCGGACNKCQDDKACADDSDCLGSTCINNKCLTPTCFDQKKNGLESEVDCGGAICQTCVQEQKCKQNIDCASNWCDNGVCVWGVRNNNLLCIDGLKNQDETDIDCGGAKCFLCKEDKSCKTNNDCWYKACVYGKCRPSACERCSYAVDVLAYSMIGPSSGILGGQSVSFSSGALVKGNPPANNITISWSADGKVVRKTSHLLSNCGEQCYVSSSFTWSAQSGSHTISAFMDADHHVAEANEGNNLASKSVYVN